MSKICPKCGTVWNSNDLFCGNCGATMTDAAPAPIRPRRSAPVSPIKKVARMIMGYMHFILIAMVIFSLVLCIMNFSGSYDVNAKAILTYGEEKQSEEMEVSLNDVAEADEFIPFCIVILAFGGLHAVLAIMAGWNIAKTFMGRKIRRSFNTYTLVGLIGSVVSLVFMWITGSASESMSGMTMKVTLTPPGIVWISILLFGALYAVNVLSRGKKRVRPA